jgi:hypothetical protein
MVAVIILLSQTTSHVYKMPVIIDFYEPPDPLFTNKGALVGELNGNVIV